MVAVLGEYDDYEKACNYWKYLKAKLKKENNQPGSNTTQLKIPASDGKRYLTNVLDSDGVISLVRQFPNNKAIPFFLIGLSTATIASSLFGEKIPPTERHVRPKSASMP